jgi:hypothetical protein
MLTDSFRSDLEFILTKIRKKENFAFTRTGDGELSIMANKFIDITSKANGEFKFDPLDKSDQFYRAELVKSYRYDHPEYYVGISCPCCEQTAKVKWMRETVGTKNVTWANLFVNGNYDFFIENFIPEFKKRNVVMVCNKKSKIENLPFEVNESFLVGTNCYKEDYEVVEQIKQYISENNIKNNIFILCAGPLSNILAYKLFDANKENTYLDCGSVFDPMMGLGRTRGYHRPGYYTKNKVCVW